VRTSAKQPTVDGLLPLRTGKQQSYRLTLVGREIASLREFLEKSPPVLDIHR